MGLELTTDKYPPITSQTRYPLRHAASKVTCYTNQAYILIVRMYNMLVSQTWFLFKRCIFGVLEAMIITVCQSCVWRFGKSKSVSHNLSIMLIVPKNSFSIYSVCKKISRTSIPYASVTNQRYNKTYDRRTYLRKSELLMHSCHLQLWIKVSSQNVCNRTMSRC